MEIGKIGGPGGRRVVGPSRGIGPRPPGRLPEITTSRKMAMGEEDEGGRRWLMSLLERYEKRRSSTRWIGE